MPLLAPYQSHQRGATANLWAAWYGARLELRDRGQYRNAAERWIGSRSESDPLHSSSVASGDNVSLARVQVAPPGFLLGSGQ
jgi:hypothetical protein